MLSSQGSAKAAPLTPRRKFRRDVDFIVFVFTVYSSVQSTQPYNLIVSFGNFRIGFTLKRLTQDHLLDQGFHFIFVGSSSFGNLVECNLVGGSKLASETKRKEVSRKSASEPIFLDQYRVFEFDDIVEFVLSKQSSRHIDIASILIFFSPNANRIVVFKREAKWVNLLVAAFTIRPLAMHRKSLAQRQMLFAFRGFFTKCGNVRWRRFGRVIENNRGNPRTSSDRLSSFGARGHCHDSGIGYHTAVATIRHGKLGGNSTHQLHRLPS